MEQPSCNSLLEANLYEYLGELLYYLEHSGDWMERDNIKRKINAVNVLLGIEKKEETFMEWSKKMFEKRMKASL